MLKIDKIQGKKWLEYDKIQNKIIQITLNLKRKRAFLLLFAHLIVPLHPRTFDRGDAAPL